MKIPNTTEFINEKPSIRTIPKRDSKACKQKACPGGAAANSSNRL